MANLARLFLLETEEGECAELGPREDALRAIIAGCEPILSFGHFSSDAMIRLLQAISTLMWGDATIINMAKSRNLKSILSRIMDSCADERIKSLARDMVEMLFAV